ncbi:MAG: alkaline phosphatase family protein [Myxococcales bacterium]|nr:alkaline phosphatase family protein [Myxococcales bacterium]
MTSRLDRGRSILALGLSALLVGLVLFAVLRVVIPARTPPPFETAMAPAKRLTRHLLFVVVDGLRYDVATDPERMPGTARALREEAGGELMAGRVSMTTSAILTIGTGQRGSFEQVVRNVNPEPPPFDSWLISARQAGLTLMSVGDPAWVEMYGAAFSERRLDPEGVAIDVDFNPITFRDARELRAKNPDVLVVHFVTPDHQAHAYTVPSSRFTEHIRGFDRDLFQFLDELSPDWTVVVAGDHGAADSGTHGADVPIQRRTALFARGPGIARGFRASGAIDQADLAGTFAALLGLPTPKHSRGHVLVEMLDLSEAARAQLACADAARAQQFAAAAALGSSAERVSCVDGPTPITTARAEVRAVDRAFDNSGGLGSPAVPWLVLASWLLGVFIALSAVGRRPLEIAALALVAVLGVLLTWGVERLPGSTPTAARALLFFLGNTPALLALVVPGRVATLAARSPWLVLCVLPGFLIATYTTNAQPEAYVAVAVASVLIVFVGGLDSARGTLRAAARVLPPAHLVLLALCLFVLFFPGTRTSELFPAWFRHDPRLTLAAGIVVIGVSVFVLAVRSEHRRRLLLALGFGVLALSALVLRRFVPPLPGRLLLVGYAALAVVFVLRRERLPALLAALATYAWVSRDIELLTLGASLLLADGVGAALARHRALAGKVESALEPGQLALIACFVFGLTFVQRIGIQGAIDFGAMDWGVAGFGDPHVPAWIVGSALISKYALGLWLVLGAFASQLGAPLSGVVLEVAFLAFLGRTVVLASMFLVAGASFWTGLRVLGDLPFALLWLLAAGLARVLPSNSTKPAQSGLSSSS